MYCLDDKDLDGKPFEKTLYGNGYNGPHRILDIGFYPCKPVLKRLSKPGDKCIVEEKRD
jgi:hypothetical protein